MLGLNVEQQMSRSYWRLRFMVAGEEWKKDVEGMLLQRLRQEVPVKSGVTRDSLSVRASETPASVKIEFFGGGATKFLLSGTQPHTIYPLSTMALHFFAAGGDEVFAANVNHPGMAQNLFHKRAFAAARGDVIGRFREAVVSTMG
jgi:hypothetical protein